MASLMASYLDFEKPVAELEARVEDLRALSEKKDSPNIGEELAKLEGKAAKALAELYATLTPWQKTQVARHPQRPHCVDYVAGLIEDFTPLAGDRKFAEDEAILCGLGRFRGQSVAVIGQEKGFDTATRLKHNFGMVKPEGYRKAVRIMELADRFGLPVLSFVDTAGAFPGIEAEERGQAEAIARATEAALAQGTPNVATVIGEGGSGGALGIAACNVVLMLEHSIYTVASPEASASILWRDSQPGARRGDEHEDHGAGFAEIRHHRRNRPGAGRRRAPRSRSDDQGRRRRHTPAPLCAMPTCRPTPCAPARQEKFLAIGRQGLIPAAKPGYACGRSGLRIPSPRRTIALRLW